MDIRFKIAAYNSSEYKESLVIREEVLRRPLGLTLSAKDVESEEEQVSIIGLLDNKVICGLVARIVEPELWEFRQIYVIASLRGQDVGHQLLNYAESLAQLEGVRKIAIRSRIEVKGFYAKCGYYDSDYQYLDPGAAHQTMVKDI